MSEKKFVCLTLLWCCRANLLLKLFPVFGSKEHAFVSAVRALTYCLMASKLWQHAMAVWILGMHALCTPLIYFRVYQMLHVLSLVMIAGVLCTSDGATRKKIILGHAVLLLYCMQRADGVIMCVTTISAYITSALTVLDKIHFGQGLHLSTDIAYLLVIACL